MRGQNLRGIVFLLSLASPRIGGTAKANLDILSKLCDKSDFKNTVFVTKWSSTTKSYTTREHELKNSYLGEFITAGAQYFRHNNSTGSAQAILQALLKVPWFPLHLETEVVEGGNLIAKSEASLRLQDDLVNKLNDEIEKRELEIKELEKKEQEDEDDQEERQLFQDRFFQLHMAKTDLLWGLAAPSDTENKLSKMKELVLKCSTEIFIM